MKVKKYFKIAVTSLQSSLVYVSNLIGGTVFFAFIIYIFLQLWKIIYGGKADLSGYTIQQVIWYCIVTEIITLSGSNAFNDVNVEIKEGSIAYLLNRPYHYVLYQLSNGAGVIAFKLAINVIMGIVIGFLYVGGLKSFRLESIPFVVLSVIISILISFFIYISIAMTSFWLEDNMAFFWVFQKLSFIFGVFLPVEFLPGWLKNIALITPFPYMSYAPAKLTVDFSVSRAESLLAAQGTYLAVFIVLAFAIYSRGVKMLNVNGG
ncbi:MAG TPA: hypothetical protein VHT34_03040 [Clostridia bacterium]|nr:hypothetical protein [Clostridia bacterium]